MMDDARSGDGSITPAAPRALLLLFSFSSEARLTQPTQLIAGSLFSLAIFANCDRRIRALLFADLEHRLCPGA